MTLSSSWSPYNSPSISGTSTSPGLLCPLVSLRSFTTMITAYIQTVKPIAVPITNAIISPVFSELDSVRGRGRGVDFSR